MEANRQLEEEKEWRRCAEEEMNLKSLKQDGLKNKRAALLEKKPAVNSAETSLLITSVEENETPLLSYQIEQEMLEESLPEISQIEDGTLHADNCLQTLQVHS